MVKWNEIVQQQQIIKAEKYKTRRSDTIKKSRAAVNKKIAELKLKDLIIRQKNFVF